MTTEKPKKILVNQLCQRGAGQLGTPWMLRVEHPVEECFDEGFFAAAAPNLMAGDSIRVTRFDDDRMIEFVDVVVLKRSFVPAAVEIQGYGPTMSFIEVPQETEIEEQEMIVSYVPEDCAAAWKGRGKWWIVGESGEVHAKGIEDRFLAHSIARGDEPLPDKEAA